MKQTFSAIVQIVDARKCRKKKMPFDHPWRKGYPNNRLVCKVAKVRGA